MSNTPNVSSAISLIYPLIKGASPVVADLAAYTFARKFFSTKTSYAAASLAGVAALVVLCSSTQKQVLNSGLIYLTYKVLLLVLNYRSSPAKSKTATDPHTSTSSSNSSGAASSPPPATEPAPGSSSSNSSGAVSSPPPATEPAPGSSASASDSSTSGTDTPASSNGSGAASSHSSSEELAPGSSASASGSSTTGTDTPASSNGSGAASSHSSSKEEPVLGSSASAAASPPPSSVPAAAPQSPRRGASSALSNSSGAASSPPPATEPAPGPSATASATPPPSSVPAAAPQSPRRAASQPLPNGHVETPPPSPFNAFPGSPSPAARQADPSASSSPSAAAASATRPRSLEERKEAAETIRARFEALAERFTFTFSGRLNITPASSGAEIQAEIYEQSGFKRPELDVKARSQWSSNTQEFGPLIRAAANEMMTSLSEIELATQRIADPEERRKAVAERLNNDPSINPLTYRTLPNIYRFVRHMKGIIHCPNVEHKLLAERRKIIYSPTLTSSDKEAFYQEGTEKNEWRKLHNQAIAAYTPYLPYLNENLRKLLVQDDGETAF